MGVEFHKNYINPALEKITDLSDGRIGSEQLHIAAREALHYAERVPFALDAIKHFAYKNPKRLGVNLARIQLDGIMGVGAGWDKKGRTALAWHAAGFSFLENGSELVLDQEGNPTSKDDPRQRTLASGRVVLNRLGFNAPGVVENARQTKKYRSHPEVKIGVSIGKNKNVADNFAPAAHYFVVKRRYEDAAYFVINVSSPNTPNLRRLQDKGPLTDIFQATNQAREEEHQRLLDEYGIDRYVPILVKVASDLPDEALMDVITVVKDNKGDGFVESNTTVNEDIKKKYGVENLPGGISGDDEDLREIVDHQVQFTYKESDKMPIISVGAINNGKQALRRVELGATVLEVVSAIRSEGFMIGSKINRELIEEMDKKGYYNISDARGVAA